MLSGLSVIRVTSFSIAESSGLFFIKYLAKNNDFIACFSTCFFQTVFRKFFFDFEVRFC